MSRMNRILRKVEYKLKGKLKYEAKKRSNGLFGKIGKFGLSALVVFAFCHYVVGDVLPQESIAEVVESTKKQFTFVESNEVTEGLPEDIYELTEDYVYINNNIPSLTVDDFYTDGEIKPYQNYSELDKLNRSGECTVLISKADMPTYERGSIGMIKPTGWHTYNTTKWGFRFEDDSEYLYNRCHIIGFQLTGIDGEHTSTNLLERNLFTGTRYMNATVMVEFENMIANYLRNNPNGYVLYKAKPIFKDNNLLANGIHLQALSLDEKLKLNVYVNNIQRVANGEIQIDYCTGEASYVKGD